jgi:predicted Zn-dependent protease
MEQLHATADADALSARISALLDANRPGVARQLLSAMRRLAPRSPVISELAVRVAVGEGHPELALAELDAGIAQFPDCASLRRFRADIRLRMDDRIGALADAADAVILDRNDPAAKALLGVLLLEHRRTKDALACLN